MLLVALLTACPGPVPRKLHFDTDPGVLRGSYVGTVDTRVWPNAEAIAGDGSVVALSFVESSDLVELWSVNGSEVEFVTGVGARAEGQWGPNAVALSGDGGRLATAYAGAVQLWSTHDMALERAITASDAFGACAGCALAAVDLDAAGALLAAGGLGPEVVIVDVASGAVRQRFAAPSAAAGAEHVAFSADGALLAGSFGHGGDGYSLRVWDVAIGSVLFAHDYELPNFPTPPLAFSADGRLIATVAERREAPGQSTVRVVEVATGRTVFQLEGERALQPAALDPSGTRLAVAEWRYDPFESGPIKLVIYDVATGEELAALQDVSRASWSADGSHLLAGPKVVDAHSLLVVADLVRGHLHELTLEAVPIYRDYQSYDVSGTLSLDGGAPIMFAGSVEGNEAQRYLQPLSRAPEPARFVLELSGHPWRLFGRQPSLWPDGYIADDPTAWVGEALDEGDGAAGSGPFRFWRPP